MNKTVINDTINKILERARETKQDQEVTTIEISDNHKLVLDIFKEEAKAFGVFRNYENIKEETKLKVPVYKPNNDENYTHLCYNTTFNGADGKEIIKLTTSEKDDIYYNKTETKFYIYLDVTYRLGKGNKSYIKNVSIDIESLTYDRVKFALMELMHDLIVHEIIL